MSPNSLSARLSTAFETACLSELQALKPGNVHIFADGHGMVVQDFVKSAKAAAHLIARPDMSVGQRILAAVEASRDAVGCNTNLGIILLAAPLIQAALYGNQVSLKTDLQTVLQALSVDDAVLACRAIQLASPAGLGTVEQYDVHEVPTVSLLTVMQAAAGRDLIAGQYANGYAEVFEFGVRRYQHLLARWERSAWVVTAIYLGFLARLNDTHIERKYGEAVASQVREEAKAHEKALMALDNPKLYQRDLLKFDADLKARGLNPGTSADLTVASILVIYLENMMTGKNEYLM